MLLCNIWLCTWSVLGKNVLPWDNNWQKSPMLDYFIWIFLMIPQFSFLQLLCPVKVSFLDFINEFPYPLASPWVCRIELLADQKVERKQNLCDLLYARLLCIGRPNFVIFPDSCSLSLIRTNRILLLTFS